MVYLARKSKPEWGENTEVCHWVNYGLMCYNEICLKLFSTSLYQRIPWWGYILNFNYSLIGHGDSTDFYWLQIFEKNPTKIKNYGIWLRYQSRTGYHNMYKEFRDTTLNGAVEHMYNEMASRHRVRFPCIQIIKTATIPAKLCKRESTKQFLNSKIKFPLVFKKIRPPTRKLKTTYKASKPNLFMWYSVNHISLLILELLDSSISTWRAYRR